MRRRERCRPGDRGRSRDAGPHRHHGGGAARALVRQAKEDISPKTVVETRGFLDRNLVPALGPVPLGKLNPTPLIATTGRSGRGTATAEGRSRRRPSDGSTASCGGPWARCAVGGGWRPTRQPRPRRPGSSPGRSSHRPRRRSPASSPSPSMPIPTWAAVHGAHADRFQGISRRRGEREGTALSLGLSGPRRDAHEAEQAVLWPGRFSSEKALLRFLLTSCILRPRDTNKETS